jgi:hypothetical protein
VATSWQSPTSGPSRHLAAEQQLRRFGSKAEIDYRASLRHAKKTTRRVVRWARLRRQGHREVDKATRAAIAGWQEERGYPKTGFLDAGQHEAL